MNTTGKDASYRGKKVVVPYFWSYYLFDYLKFLVPQLIKDGFDVTVLTYEAQIAEAFRSRGSRIAWVPPILRYLMARSGGVLHRVALWISAWCWVSVLRRQYDFAVLPWDNKPVWYVMSCLMPSLTCHNTTELIDVRLTLKRDVYKSSSGPGALIHRAFLVIDALTGKRFLPRWPGQINRYFPRQLVIDRIMGYRAQNFYCGFGKVTYLTVSGHQISENYQKCGLESRKVVVTGNPSYDFVRQLEHCFSDRDRERFRMDLGVSAQNTLFSLFLSPSSFTEAQLSEVLLVVREIGAIVPDSFVILKFHPKTSEDAVTRFRLALEDLGDRVLLITEYLGEEHNVKLILAADYVVQKQSTVGFIAILLRRDLISYNIEETNYEDDMYKVLDASVHVESAPTLRNVLHDIKNGEFADLRERQREACRRFCLETSEANKNISKVIQRYFAHPAID